MTVPHYGDRAGLIQYLSDAATVPPNAQRSPYWRTKISRAVKRLMLLPKLREKEFTQAMRGIALTPEILYSLTYNHVENRSRSR